MLKNGFMTLNVYLSRFITVKIKHQFYPNLKPTRIPYEDTLTLQHVFVPLLGIRFQKTSLLAKR